MSELGSKLLTAPAELEWLTACGVEAFLADFPADLPVNLIGTTARALAARLTAAVPDLQINPIAAPVTGDSDDFQGSSGSVIDWNRLIGSLNARGSTVVLDPTLGQRLLENPDALERIAMKTFDRLLLPAFVKAANWQVLYSDEFSFEEPVNADLEQSHWCWSVSDKPATVLIQANAQLKDHLFRFAISTLSPGTFVCRIGDQVQAHTATPETLRTEFSFPLRQASPFVRLEITFTGQPVPPENPMDERKKLYFSYGGTVIEGLGAGLLPSDAMPAPSGMNFMVDRAVRRALHGGGFFEVQTLATPWIGLAALRGVRSCFDYRCGYSFRDTDPSAFARFGEQHDNHYAFPAIWYQARRMPTPGIEWTTTSERLTAALLWHRE